MFASEMRKKRAERLRSWLQWRWHLDEVFVKINSERHYLWRAVDHEGQVLEGYVTKRRDRAAALKFMKKGMKQRGHLELIVTDKLRSYGAAMKVLENAARQETRRQKMIERKIRSFHFDDENERCTAFAECEDCRSLFPFTHPFSTTSIRIAA